MVFIDISISLRITLQPFPIFFIFFFCSSKQVHKIDFLTCYNINLDSLLGFYSVFFRHYWFQNKSSYNYYVYFCIRFISFCFLAFVVVIFIYAIFILLLKVCVLRTFLRNQYLTKLNSHAVYTFKMKTGYFENSETDSRRTWPFERVHFS